jgi:hypothetical protein
MPHTLHFIADFTTKTGTFASKLALLHQNWHFCIKTGIFASKLPVLVVKSAIKCSVCGIFSQRQYSKSKIFF